jgi:hypothetical protein
MLEFVPPVQDPGNRDAFPGPRALMENLGLGPCGLNKFDIIRILEQHQKKVLRFMGSLTISALLGERRNE